MIVSWKGWYGGWMIASASCTCEVLSVSMRKIFWVMIDLTYYGWYAWTSKTRWFFNIFVVLFFYYIFHAFFSGTAFVVDSFLYRSIRITYDLHSEDIQIYYGKNLEKSWCREDLGVHYHDYLIPVLECLSKIRSRLGNDLFYFRLYLFVEMIGAASIPHTRTD